MHVISRSRLREFWERQPDAEEALRAWYKVVEHANWLSPDDVKNAYRSADILKNGRVVFNIRENRFLLIVKFIYPKGRAYIRFVGTHREYDRVDADTV
jgi:mRNA interferase HigB